MIAYYVIRKVKNMSYITNLIDRFKISVIKSIYTKIEKWYNNYAVGDKQIMGDFVLANNYYGSADIIDLAHWFVLKENMSHKKIQKLCYYAQAWSLAFNDMDIIEGIEFEAWPHGPVNRQLWDVLKRFGWRDIKISDEMLDVIKQDNPLAFSKDQTEILNFVWENYGDYYADDLEAISHNEDPWKEARIGKNKFEKSNQLISKETMKRYYSNVYEQA